MRITLVIAALWGGGAERLTALLASAWAEKGEKVTVLAMDDGTRPEYPVHPSVNVQHLDLRSISKNALDSLFRNLRRIRILHRAIRDSKPDVVISHVDNTNVLTLLATRGLGFPIIVGEQTDPALYRIGRLGSSFRRFVYPWADSLVCPVKASLARFQRMTNVSGCVIPNPVVLQGTAGSARETRDGHVLVAMGRLVHQKGFDLLLQAFARIAGQHSDWSLTILGEGPLKNDLEAQVEAFGLQGRVWLRGHVKNPSDILRAADLFVFSSRFEGFGMALAEAMACGLPAVSFDCPEGPADIIRHEIDGILVPPEDVSALASALDDLMGDPEKRKQLAARAIEVLERFSIERVLSMWQELFDSLITQPA